MGLPDGNIVSLATERFRCPEALFKPALMGLEAPGIHTLVFEAITACDVDMRRDLCDNIVLLGGTTMFPGFGARIQKELTALIPTTWRIRIRRGEDLVFIGASMLARALKYNGSFTEMLVTSAEYNEFGPDIIHQKCF